MPRVYARSNTHSHRDKLCGIFIQIWKQRISWRIYHHPLCRRSYAEIFYVDLLQFLLRPDLDIYFRNKKTAKTKQPIYFEPTQPNKYCIIQNKFQVWIVMFIYCLHNYFYFSKKISLGKNIVLSKINFKCELLCSYCLHNLYRICVYITLLD